MQLLDAGTIIRDTYEVERFLGYHTVCDIQRGKNGEVIRIPVVEGEHSLADRNRLIGFLPIEGVNIARDLPFGSEIEVTLRIDASRIITVEAYVPILDAEFRVKIDLVHKRQDPESLKSGYEAEMVRIADLKQRATGAGAQPVLELINQTESAPLLQEIRELVGRRLDPDAAAKCEKRLLELRVQLDMASDALEWPALVAEARELLANLVAADAESGTQDQHKQTAKLKSEIEQLVKSTQPDDALRGKVAQAQSLWFSIIRGQSRIRTF